MFIIGSIIVIIFWVYSSALYLGIIPFPWPLGNWFAGPDWMLNSGLPLGLTRSPSVDIVAIVIFATYPLCFYVGTELAFAGLKLGKTRRMDERKRIVKELAEASFPRGGAIPPGAEDVNASQTVDSFLLIVPPLFSDALTLLLFVFDSRFLVFLFTGRWKRFVDLETRQEKQKYIQTWDTIPFLLSTAEVLRITISYGYYTKPKVYTKIGYNGPMTPDLPPWYNPGPKKVRGHRP